MYRLLAVAAQLGLIFGVVLVLGVILHEGAHATSAVLLGARIETVQVLPGIRIFPELGFVPWDGSVARVEHSPLNSARDLGVVLIAGSLVNALVAYVALALAGRRGILGAFLLTAALVLGFDLINYTFLPAVGLRHWVLVGGVDSETLNAARMLGLETPTFLLVVCLHAVVLCWWWSVRLIGYRATLNSRPSKSR